MPVQQLFYKTVVPVSFERHRDASIRTGVDYGFARGTNAAPVTAAEFLAASAEHPIVFAGEGDRIFPSVILGGRDAQNIHVDADGRWTGHHVPAFVRRYPFVFSVDEAGERFTLNVDEEAAAFNREGRGERLFDSEGEQTQYLKSVLTFLQNYQMHFVRTQAFCQRLVEHDLLHSVQAQFDGGAGGRSRLGGFMAVNREKLKALPDDVICEMFRRDELECLYLHLASLNHFRTMAQAMGAAPAPKDADDPAMAADPEPPAEPAVTES